MNCVGVQAPGSTSRKHFPETQETWSRRSESHTLLLQDTKPWPSGMGPSTSPAGGGHHTLLLPGQVMPVPGALSLSPKPATSSAGLVHKDPPGMKSRAHIDFISKLLIKTTAQ